MICLERSPLLIKPVSLSFGGLLLSLRSFESCSPYYIFMQRFYRELSVGIAPIVLCKLDFLVQFAVVSDSQSESLADEDILILLVVISGSYTEAQLYLIARLTANDLSDFRDISLEVVLHSAQLSLSICKVLDGLPLSVLLSRKVGPGITRKFL